MTLVQPLPTIASAGTDDIITRDQLAAQLGWPDPTPEELAAALAMVE